MDYSTYSDVGIVGSDGVIRYFGQSGRLPEYCFLAEWQAIMGLQEGIIGQNGECFGMKVFIV